MVCCFKITFHVQEGKVNGKPTSIPQYDVSKLVKMYIGVNGKDMKKVMKDQSLINYPSKVWSVVVFAMRSGKLFDLAKTYVVVGLEKDGSLAKGSVQTCHQPS